MSSIFSKIIRGEIPCYRISESEYSFSFLDINPLAIGHTLVVPKVEVDYVFDIDDSIYQDLWRETKKISSALKDATGCKRVGLAVIGFEVPHAHIHLVPMNEIGDINFSKPKLILEQNEYLTIAGDIRKYLS